MTINVARTAWQPLLTGRSADEAAEAVEEIAGALSAIPSQDFVSWSLADGDAGIALFHAYHARAFPSDVRDAAARRRLDRAVTAVGETRMRPDLYGGFSGVAWVAEHLNTGTIVSDGDDLDASIDEALEAGLREASREASWWQQFELIAGLAGLGVYALERLPRPSAVRLAELIVGHLADSCERTPDGITWKTAPSHLSDRSRRKAPGGYYNLGVAHGVPGVIGFLSGVCAARVAEPVASELLEGAVSWVLAQRLAPGGPADFPMWIAADDRSLATRTSWCYGNPGIAVTLLAAARVAGEANWEREAIDLARACAARGDSDSRVSESCLCHGSAGNAHLFNRLFQTTGDEQFRRAALGWFERTLALRNPGPGPAGFKSRTLDHTDTETWARLPGFLMGIAGVGLALLAATRPIEPDWDRVLLAALPPRR